MGGEHSVVGYSTFPLLVAVWHHSKCSSLSIAVQFMILVFLYTVAQLSMLVVESGIAWQPISEAQYSGQSVNIIEQMDASSPGWNPS